MEDICREMKRNRNKIRKSGKETESLKPHKKIRVADIPSAP
jgi:hypothetical protein